MHVQLYTGRAHWWNGLDGAGRHRECVSTGMQCCAHGAQHAIGALLARAYLNVMSMFSSGLFAKSRRNGMTPHRRFILCLTSCSSAGNQLLIAHELLLIEF